MKRRPRKRMIFKLLLFLLAGAIINVAVAWGMHLASPKFAMPQGSPSTEKVLYTDQQLDSMTIGEVREALKTIAVERQALRKTTRSAQRLLHEFERRVKRAEFLMRRSTRDASAVCGWPDDASCVRYQ